MRVCAWWLARDCIRVLEHSLLGVALPMGGGVSKAMYEKARVLLELADATQEEKGFFLLALYFSSFIENSFIAHATL